MQFSLPEEYAWTDEKIAALCEMLAAETNFEDICWALDMPPDMVRAKSAAVRHAGWVSMNTWPDKSAP